MFLIDDSIKSESQQSTFLENLITLSVFSFAKTPHRIIKKRRQMKNLPNNKFCFISVIHVRILSSAGENFKSQIKSRTHTEMFLNLKRLFDNKRRLMIRWLQRKEEARDSISQKENLQIYILYVAVKFVSRSQFVKRRRSRRRGVKQECGKVSAMASQR